MINDPHDKYFRKAMQIKRVATEFLLWFLPESLSELIDFESLELVEGTYIDESLKKTISDVVFDCQYRVKGDTSGVVQHSKIVILIEHQSSPERFMPIRVFNYLFSLLNQHIHAENFATDIEGNQLLPAVYPIVFYHGKPKRYPYSMKVLDCVVNPANIMDGFGFLDIQLVNVNELIQEDINQHGLAGVMTDAMRRIPTSQTEQNYLSIFKRLGEIDKIKPIPKGFTKTTMKYMINVKDVEDIDALIEKSDKLSEPVRGEIMTIAEALEARGEARNKLEMAMGMLEEDIDKATIAKITGFDMEKIEELVQELDKRH